MSKKKDRKVFTLKVTEGELFAITNAIGERLNSDPFGQLTTVDKTALYGVLRKADQSISEYYQQLAIASPNYRKEANG